MKINGKEYEAQGITIPVDKDILANIDGRTYEKRLENYVRYWLHNHNPSWYFGGQFLQQLNYFLQTGDEIICIVYVPTNLKISEELEYLRAIHKKLQSPKYIDTFVKIKLDMNEKI